MRRLLPLLALSLSACFDEPHPEKISGIFIDEMVSTNFQAFMGASLTALQRDAVVKHAGTGSLRIDVPAPGDAAGAYAGGAFVASADRDLTSFNAITFWAKATGPVSIDSMGFGNDNTGNSIYPAERRAILLSTEWQQYVLPIPAPDRLGAERGLFYFGASAQGVPAAGYSFWLDDLQFETLSADRLTAPKPVIKTETIVRQSGDAISVSGPRALFTADGQEIAVELVPAYFGFVSSNTSVVAFHNSPKGLITGPGSATVTGSMGAIPAEGVLTVSVVDVESPSTAPPVPPSRTAADVRSLFGAHFTAVPVDTFLAGFSQAGLLVDTTVGGEPVKKYEVLTFAGIEMSTTPLDASTMTALHLDIWTPDSTRVGVKLVDFGAGGVFGGGDDSEFEVGFDSSSTPRLQTGQWMSLEIPMTSFTGLLAQQHIAQLILSGTESTVWVANVYFHR